MREVRTRWELPGWRVEAWWAPSADGRVSQDDHLVEPLPGGGLRVAVLDGVTPLAQTPGLAGLELGTGVNLCIVPPEQAAAELRDL